MTLLFACAGNICRSPIMRACTRPRGISVLDRYAAL